MKDIRHVGLAIVLIMICAIAVLYTQSDENFLPFLRYRSISAWDTVSVVIGIGFNEVEDGSITYGIGCGITDKRTLKPWFGGEQTINRISHVFFEEPLNIIHFYNPRMLRFGDSWVIPLRPGTTQIVLKYKSSVDTTTVAILREHGKLVIRD